LNSLVRTGRFFLSRFEFNTMYFWSALSVDNLLVFRIPFFSCLQWYLVND
jgi:hypothetical protein